MMYVKELHKYQSIQIVSLKKQLRFPVSAWKNPDLQNYIVNKQKTVSYELRYLYSIIQKEIL